MRYNNEVNIAIQSGDLVIAALQMLPYPMTYCGKQSLRLMFQGPVPIRISETKE